LGRACLAHRAGRGERGGRGRRGDVGHVVLLWRRGRGRLDGGRRRRGGELRQSEWRRRGQLVGKHKRGVGLEQRGEPHASPVGVSVC
jgi:hypothetical protein